MIVVSSLLIDIFVDFEGVGFAKVVLVVDDLRVHNVSFLLLDDDEIGLAKACWSSH